jgi:hypothetical protein
MSGRKRNKQPFRLPFIVVMVSVSILIQPQAIVAQDVDPRLAGIMFYNVENLFDCFDDSLSRGDDDFLPSSPRHWSFKRYQEKLQKTAKVIMAAGQWNPPFLVGLCEIENSNVLWQLTRNTGLSELGYRFSHFESPDPRGIDVALLYRKDCFTVLEEKPVKVVLPNNKTTRDILFVKGVAHKTDTLFVMVNHWPSRLGGESESDINRMAAANCLSKLCDSLRKVHPRPFIIAMGDFNDGPTDESIIQLKKFGMEPMNKNASQKNIGSNKFRQTWETIDQIILSEYLSTHWQQMGLLTSFKILDLPFLLVKDETYLGIKPFRTYLGPQYIGGYSDHLPVIVTFGENTISAPLPNP